MRFLLDVCVSSRALRAFLVGNGHDVVSAAEIDARASDDRLLAMALQDERVLLTQDKDFGELGFVRGFPHGPIVRFVELTVEDQARAMADLLARHASDLAGRVVVTVTLGRIRIRR